MNAAYENQSRVEVALVATTTAERAGDRAQQACHRLAKRLTGDYRVLPGDPPARGAMVGTYGALIRTAVSELGSPRQAEAVTPRASPAAKDTIE